MNSRFFPRKAVALEQEGVERRKTDCQNRHATGNQRTDAEAAQDCAIMQQADAVRVIGNEPVEDRLSARQGGSTRSAQLRL